MTNSNTESASESISNTIIGRAVSFVRIFAHEKEEPREERLILLDSLEWNDTHEYGGWLTLEEISMQLTERGYERTFYVWDDSPSAGTIYQFGNYDPPQWDEHGTTRGYA